jgi:hypothetical protein
MTWALPYIQLILRARGSIEVAGVAPGTLLTFLVVCIVLFLLSVAAHAAWWVFVAPVNAEISTWTPDAIPGDWTWWRS